MDAWRLASSSFIFWSRAESDNSSTRTGASTDGRGGSVSGGIARGSSEALGSRPLPLLLLDFQEARRRRQFLRPYCLVRNLPLLLGQEEFAPSRAPQTQAPAG